MKALFNKLSTLIFLAVFSTAVMAQPVPDTTRINIGLSGGLPIALDNMYTYNAGAYLQVDYPLTKTLYVTGSAGYNTLFASPNFSTTEGGILNVKAANMQTAPLKIGLKIFCDKAFLFGRRGWPNHIVKQSGSIRTQKQCLYLFAAHGHVIFS